MLAGLALRGTPPNKSFATDCFIAQLILLDDWGIHLRGPSWPADSAADRPLRALCGRSSLRLCQPNAHLNQMLAIKSRVDKEIRARRHYLRC